LHLSPRVELDDNSSSITSVYLEMLCLSEELRRKAVFLLLPSQLKSRQWAEIKVLQQIETKI